MTDKGCNLIAELPAHGNDACRQEEETSVSLLERLRTTSDTKSWEHFVDLYTPLIKSWLEEYSHHQDISDVVQEILTELVSRLGTFRRRPRAGSFRRWLRTVTVHRLCSFLRCERVRPLATGDTGFLAKLKLLEDPHSSLSQVWDRQHDEHVLRGFSSR